MTAVAWGGRFRRPLALALVLLCGLLVPPAHAEMATFDSVAVLLEAGDYAGARAAVDTLPGRAETRAINSQFLEALILRAQGRRAEAIEAMRAIIDANPQFARVRHELAMTLLETSDWDAASYQLNLLAQSTADSELRTVYRGYMDAIVQARPWQFEASFGVAPSTNINNATRPQIFVFNGLPFVPTQTAQSGVGVNAALAGSYRFDLGADTALTLGVQTSGRMYPDHAFDQVLAGTFAELSYRQQDWRIGGGLGVERLFFGGLGYRTSVGPQGSLAYNFGRAGSITLTGQARRHFYDPGFTEDELRGGATYAYGISSTSSVALGLEATAVWTSMAHNDYVGIKPWVGFATELPLGLIVSSRLSYELRDFAAPIPWLAQERDENRWEVSAGVTMKGLAVAGFAPRLEYSYAVTDSPIDLFDVESQTVSLTMTKAF